MIEVGTVLKTFSGDSYDLTLNISGLAATTLYGIYYQVNSPKPIIAQQQVTTDDAGKCSVTFYISAEENSQTGTFTYGVKVCHDQKEDTIKSGKILIANKLVEGLDEK